MRNKRIKQEGGGKELPGLNRRRRRRTVRKRKKRRKMTADWRRQRSRDIWRNVADYGGGGNVER